MYKALLSLAALASTSQPGLPPLLPLNLPAAFAARPLVMAELFAPLPEPVKHEDWIRYTLPQSWLGQEPWPSVYLLHASGYLQRIEVTPPAQACDGLEQLISHWLGAPVQSGNSPQYLYSMHYARWEREGLIFVAEFFVPGCELAIY